VKLKGRSSLNAGVLRRLLLLGLAFVSLVLMGGSVSADLASDLSGAESRAASAEAEVAAAQERLDAARADYTTAARQAGPYAEAARVAREESRDLRDGLLDRQQEARAEIARLEAGQQQEEEDHDDEVTLGIGIGVALLIAAAIALGWSWVRASAPVAGLVRMQLGQALAACVGGGFLMLAIGAALAGGDGFVAALGSAIATLGLVLPVALLLARHSVEVEHGKAKPLLRRKQLPSWVSRAAAALFLLFGLVMLISGVATEDPDPPPVSAQLREEAEDPEEGPEATRLTEAETEAAKTAKEATGPAAKERATVRAVREASRELRRAKSLLVDAKADARRFERRLVALVAQEEREAEKQAERETEEAEELEEIEEEFAEEEGSSGCDPNYSGCVPAYPPDVDCAEVGESVSSYGTDPHGLDADGDGVGCE
jgi:hypothetical protein